MKDNIELFYLINLDLINTNISSIINMLSKKGQFAISENNYYLKTNLTKNHIIKIIKNIINKDEQVLVKQIDNIDLFCFENNNNKNSKKKITYKYASNMAISRIDSFLDSVYEELKNQIKERGEQNN